MEIKTPSVSLFLMFPCFDEVNQRKSVLWATKAAAPPCFILTDTNAKSSLYLAFLSFNLFCLLSPCLLYLQAAKLSLAAAYPSFERAVRFIILYYVYVTVKLD